MCQTETFPHSAVVSAKPQCKISSAARSCNVFFFFKYKLQLNSYTKVPQSAHKIRSLTAVVEIGKMKRSLSQILDLRFGFYFLFGFRAKFQRQRQLLPIYLISNT